MLCQKYLNTNDANKYKNKDKFKYQGQSARSQRWFDIDIDLIEEFLSHVKMISIERYVKDMTKQKIQIHLKCLKFQS